MTRPGAIVYSDPDPVETLQLIVSTVELPGDACVRITGGNGWFDVQIPLPFNVLMVTSGIRWSHTIVDRVVKLSDLADCFFANDELERIDAHLLTPDFPNLPENHWWESRLSSGYVTAALDDVKRSVGEKIAHEPAVAGFYAERIIEEVATMPAMGISRPEGLLVVPAVLLLMADLLELLERVPSVVVIANGPWIGLRFGSTTLYATATDGSWTVNVDNPFGNS